MQKHTKVYFNFFGYDESSYINCEMECGARAVDIHHLERRNKTKNDYIENLVALCRDCHINCNESSFNMYVRVKHLELVMIHIVSLIQLEKRLNENRQNDI
tara:strand:+ start:25711 stop:26013 length:303 start_codon:yes stop_codon:yes gene_type:complete